MARKSMYTVVAIALVLAIASTVWAAPSRRHQTHARARTPVHRVATAPAWNPWEGATTQTSEHARCAATCAQVIPFYEKQYAARSTHDGAASCWRTCWTRFGNPRHQNADAATQKLLWRDENARHLRANQCARTCWDNYHPNAARQGIAVAQYEGYRSVPRPFTLPPQPTVIVEGSPATEAQTPEAAQAAPEEGTSMGTAADQSATEAAPAAGSDSGGAADQSAAAPSSDDAAAAPGPLYESNVARPDPVIITPTAYGTYGAAYAGATRGGANGASGLVTFPDAWSIGGIPGLPVYAGGPEFRTGGGSSPTPYWTTYNNESGAPTFPNASSYGSTESATTFGNVVGFAGGFSAATASPLITFQSGPLYVPVPGQSAY